MTQTEEIRTSSGGIRDSAIGWFLVAALPMTLPSTVGTENTSSGEDPATTWWPDYNLAVMSEATNASQSGGERFSLTIPVGESAVTEGAPAAVMELRRLTGLTWEQLADLFSVNRRSVHNWASGRTPSRRNEERLRRLLAVMRAVDRGSVQANRSALFGSLRDGLVLFELLKEGRYSEVQAAIGQTGTRRHTPRPLSRQVEEARRPAGPDVLVGAREDVAPIELGEWRPARATRTNVDKGDEER